MSAGPCFLCYNTLMNLQKLFSGFKVKSLGRALGLKEKIGKADFGILKVAFMVAALDGEVTDKEYEAFDLLAKKCRGYTPKAAAQALDEAMRSAGYLMLLSPRVKEADLVKAFVAEAREALPNGFAYLSLADVRRAVVTWIVMGLSDGDYSSRERACIEALRKLFAELKVMRMQQEEAQWLSLSSDFRQAYGVPSLPSRGMVELVSKDFVSRVEDLVAQYGDDAAASRELQGLIAGK